MVSEQELEGDIKNKKKYKLKRKVKKHVQGFLEFRSLTSQWILAIHVQGLFV